jgi:hypothetical protein
MKTTNDKIIALAMSNQDDNFKLAKTFIESQDINIDLDLWQYLRDNEVRIVPFNEMLGYYLLWKELGLEDDIEPTDDELRAIEEELETFNWELCPHFKTDYKENGNQR